MTLFDRILGPKCADCDSRIKAKQIPLPNGKWLCSTCKEKHGAAAEEASFLQAAIAADQAWFRTYDNNLLQAIKSGNKVEEKRLFDEANERLRAEKEDTFGYYRKYYAHLRAKNR